MTEFPRVKIERHPMQDARKYKLSLRTESFCLASDGSLHIWIDRGDLTNLQFDCNQALLEEDMEASGGGPAPLLSSA